MAQAAEYIDKIDQAANIVEDVSINLRDLLAQMRELSLVKQDAYNAVYLLRRDLGRAVAILRWRVPNTTNVHLPQGGGAQPTADRLGRRLLNYRE